MDHTEPLQAFQRLNIIPTRPSQANDEVRAPSVYALLLGTRWHLIECLYFLLSLSLCLRQLQAVYSPCAAVGEHREEPALRCVTPPLGVQTCDV